MKKFLVAAFLFILLSGCSYQPSELSDYDKWRLTYANCKHKWVNMKHTTFGMGYDFKCSVCGNIVHASNKKRPSASDRLCYDCRQR